MSQCATRKHKSFLRAFINWRRRRDLNPRYLAVQTLSKRPPSTTRPLLRIGKRGNKPRLQRFEILSYSRRFGNRYSVRLSKKALPFRKWSSFLEHRKRPSTKLSVSQKKGIRYSIRIPFRCAWRREWDLNPREGF